MWPFLDLATCGVAVGAAGARRARNRETRCFTRTGVSRAMRSDDLAASNSERQHRLSYRYPQKSDVIDLTSDGVALPPRRQVFLPRVGLRGRVRPPVELLCQRNERVAHVAVQGDSSGLQEAEDRHLALCVALPAVHSSGERFVDDLPLRVPHHGEGEDGADGLLARGRHSRQVRQGQGTRVRSLPPHEEEHPVRVFRVHAQAKWCDVQVRESLVQAKDRIGLHEVRAGDRSHDGPAEDVVLREVLLR
mmetsp:Transcript_5882/g.16038  ORF Transcript_5882/g.16038 Transcript_5882/m.16038 type:complete len:248 (+) Transcript_5882:99-842(+)